MNVFGKKGDRYGVCSWGFGVIDSIGRGRRGFFKGVIIVVFNRS